MKAFAAHLCSATVAALCLFSVGKANAEMNVFDTITGKSVYDATVINSTYGAAQQFMPDVGVELSSVTFSIGGVVGTPWAKIDLVAQRTTELSVNYDGSPVSTTNWPGTSIYTLYNGIAPTANQDWTISATGGPLLQADTKYWISFTVIGSGSIAWNFTSGEVLGTDSSLLAGVTWDTTQPENEATNQGYYTGPQMMTVNVPEPTTVGFALIGLGGLAFARRMRLI